MADTIQAVSWSLDGGGAGNFYLRRVRERPNDVLWASIHLTGIETELRGAFQITEPLWYGLWIDSPLTAKQCRLLHTLFSDVVATVPRYAKELQEFLPALHEAAETGKALAVKLFPPGHVDLGWVTTFVHCPRCKAEGPFERWQDSYPTAPVDCPVCGHSYSPAATCSSEREYYAEQANCATCGASYRLKDLSEHEIAILEDQHYFREFSDELAWLQRVAAFYERHPDQEGRIKPDFLMLIESDDERVQQALADGVPFADIELPADKSPSLPDPKDLSAEDCEVVEFLRHNHFSLPQRLAFVEDQIADLRPKVATRSVSCRQCGGNLQ